MQNFYFHLFYEYLLLFFFFSDGPENVQIKGPNQINIKGALHLTCSAKSTPSARFTWFVNGTETPRNSAEYIKEQVELSDSGNYTCQAWNNVTDRRSSSTVHALIVTGTCKWLSFTVKPLIGFLKIFL